MIDKIITFFKEHANTWYFSIGCYGIGLTYLSLYYSAFDVPIIYYLTLNDMLLIAVTIMVPLIVVAFIVDLVILETIKSIIIKSVKKRALTAKEESGFYAYSAFLLSMIMLLIVIFKVIKNNPNLYFFVLVSSMILFAKLAVRINSSQRIGPAITVILGLVLGISSLVEYTKTGVSNKDVKFTYENKIVSTRYYSNLSYIGETSNTMFLYNLESRVTFVFEKSKISNLIYIDKLKSQDWQQGKIKYFELKDALFRKADDSINNNHIWTTSDKKTFIWKSDKTPVGISYLLRQLDNVIRVNGFDVDLPTDDTSSIPENFNLRGNNVALNEALMKGEFEIDKWWAHPTGYIHLRLDKDLYMIEIIYKRVPNLEKDVFYKTEKN